MFPSSSVRRQLNPYVNKLIQEVDSDRGGSQGGQKLASRSEVGATESVMEGTIKKKGLCSTGAPEIPRFCQTNHSLNPPQR